MTSYTGRRESSVQEAGGGKEMSHEARRRHFFLMRCITKFLVFACNIDLCKVSCKNSANLKQHRAAHAFKENVLSTLSAGETSREYNY